MFGKRAIQFNTCGRRSGLHFWIQFIGLTIVLVSLGTSESSYAQEIKNTQVSQSEVAQESKAHPASRIRGDKHARKYDIEAIGNRGVDSGLNFYSREAEQRLGEVMAAEFEHDLQFFDDQKTTEYIEHLARYLARNSDTSFPFTVRLFASAEVNAFALPGGHLYVSTSLIIAADNEAQLAGAIAHEIGHIAARHGTKQRSRSKLFSVVSVPAVLLGGPAGYVLQAAAYTRPFVLGKFSRSAEQEADTLGLEYAYTSGYDPQEYVALLEKFAGPRKGHKWMRLFSSHPPTASRIKNAQLAIQRYLPERNDYVVTTSDFEQVKSRLEQMIERGALLEPGQSMPALRKASADRSTNPDQDFPSVEPFRNQRR